MYKVTITEDDNTTVTIVRYEQIVDQLDLKAVIDAVNRSPQPQRERRVRSDAGIKRLSKEVDVGLEMIRLKMSILLRDSF